jgi:hypothetical protein
MYRAISHSEADALLSCQAKHAFAYTGRLTDGSTLTARTVAPILRDGRAWGAGVASYHALGHGTAAIYYSLAEDKADQLQAGVFSEPAFGEAVQHLTMLLDHYVTCDTEGRLLLVERERELLVPLHARQGTSRRRSNRYRLHAFLDGVHIDGEQRVWIVEFKLRNRLQPLSQIVLNRQIRWYAWAWREQTGREPVGVIVDERLNELPASVRLNKDGRVSKVQSCTPELYTAACADAGQEPDDEVLTQLRSKVWQQRHRILLRPDELDEAGRQLASTAQLTHLMDSGALYPTRNPAPQRCSWCPFQPICADPADRDLIDALYTREVPKRDRHVKKAEEMF